jgi:hypothetical protein
MQGKPPAALGSGAYVAGVVGAVALLGEPSTATVAAIAVGGFCLGVVAGGLAVTHSQLLDHRLTSRSTGGALVGLGVWVTWTGVQSGSDGHYQLAIGSVFLAVVGWAVMVGREHPAGNGETLATLPRTMPRETAGNGRREQLKRLGDVGAVVVVAVLFARAVTRSDPSSWVFAGLFLVVTLPGTRSRVRLTDSGLLTTRYVFWRVPFDLSQTPWAALYGYEATDDRLRIDTNYGPDIVYDRDQLGDIDHVVGVLDDHIPQL